MPPMPGRDDHPVWVDAVEQDNSSAFILVIDPTNFQS